MREFNALTGYTQVDLTLRGEKYRVVDFIPIDIEGTKHREFLDLTRSQEYGSNMIFRLKLFTATLTNAKKNKFLDKFRKKLNTVTFVHIRLMNCTGCKITDSTVILIPNHINTLKALVAYLARVDAFGEVVEPKNLLDQTPLGGFKNSSSLQVTSGDDAKVTMSNGSKTVTKNC